MPSRLRSVRLHVMFVVFGALVLTGCRLDVSVDVEMQPDGTGTVTLVAVADAELVAKVPDLIDDLRLDDAVANGWVVDGPTPDAGGGASITLSHPFSSAAELASVLNSIGPPLTDMEAARNVGSDADGGSAATTNAINGTLVLPNGFESFADAALVQAAGGQPFGDELAASGLAPAEAMSFTFRVELPGELVSSETGTEIGDGVIEWRAALDGTQVSLLTQTVQQPASAGNSWAKPLSSFALVLLIVWIVFAAAFIAFVAIARRSRYRRRERALRNLR